MAEDTEKILKIEVSYDDAIRKIADYRTKLDEVREREKALKKELKSGSINREEYNLKMAESKMESQQYAEVIRTTTKALQNQLKTEKEQEGSLNSLRAKLSNATAAYDQLGRAERESLDGENLRNRINEITTELKEAEEETQRYYRNVGNYEGSLAPLFKQLENKLESQKEKYNELIRTQGEHSKAVREQKKAIEATQMEMELFGEAADKASGDVLSLISSSIGLDSSMVKSVASLGSLTKGAQHAATGVKLLGRQLLALMANPVVAFLALVATALMAVTKGISSSEENTNRLSVVLAPFNRLLDGCVNVLQRMAGAVLWVVEEGGALLSWISKAGEKIPVIGKAFSSVNNEVRKSIELEKEKIAIEQQSRKDEVQNAKDALAVSELRTKAKEKEKYTAQERLKFVQEANRLEKEQAERNVELAERRLKALQEESKRADNNAETNKELARLEAEYYNRKREYFEKSRELIEQENTLKQESAAAEKARLDKIKETAEAERAIRAKEVEEIRKAEDELLKLVTDSRERQSMTIQYEYSRQIEDLKMRLKIESDLTLQAKEAINKQIVALEKQKEEALRALSYEETRKEIENKQKLISLQLEAVVKGSEMEYQLKLKYLESQRSAELANAELTEEMKEAIKKKYIKKINDLNIEHEKERLESKKRFIELEIEAEKESSDIKTDLLIERLNLERDIELSNAELTEEEKLLIKEKYKNKELSLEEEAREAKIAQIKKLQAKEYDRLEKAGASRYQLQAFQAYQEIELLRMTEAEAEEIALAKFELFNTLLSQQIEATEAMGECSKTFTKISKVLALAQIAIETGRAISLGISGAMTLPFPGNIAAVASTIATIMANIATATKTVKSAKFAKGGLVQGPGTGTSDSIPAQLSNGESVLTANATSMFGPMLSAFNQMGGGVPIPSGSSVNQNIGKEMLAEAFSMALEKFPNPVVSVEEINNVNDRVKVLRNLGCV